MTDTDDHIHIWEREVRNSHMAGTPHRVCLVPGCRSISLDLEDEDLEEPWPIVCENGHPLRFHTPATMYMTLEPNQPDQDFAGGAELTDLSVSTDASDAGCFLKEPFGLFGCTARRCDAEPVEGAVERARKLLDGVWSWPDPLPDDSVVPFRN